MIAQLRAFDRLSDMLGLDEKKGYRVAVAFALLFVLVLATGFFAYLIVRSSPPEGYSTLYVIDTGKTLDLPETVVIGQNSTFQILAVAENHLGKELPFEIRVKINRDVNTTFPLDIGLKSTYPFTLDDGEKSEQLATVIINETGWHMVVFELWSYNGSAEEFTGNACVLNIKAVSQS